METTKKLKTPTGEHEITFKAFITGEDRRATRRLILKLHAEEKVDKVEGIEEAENDMIARVVLEIDGSNENILGRIIEFKVADYDFVMETINEISKGFSEEKKTISNGSTSPSSTEKRSD